MNCRRLADLLLDYVEGRLPAEDTAELDRHLRGCGPCVEFLDEYREMPRLAREATADAMPDEVRDRLRRFLEERRG